MCQFFVAIIILLGNLSSGPFIDYLEKSYGLKDSVTIEEDLVLFAKYKGESEVRIDSVLSYTEYKQSIKNFVFLKSFSELQEEEQKSAAQGRSAGIIPTIQIPIYIPPSFSFLGKEGAKIDVDGRQSVRFSFEKNVNRDPLSYIGGTSSYFNPQLEQQLRLNLNALIGTKLSIRIDHDSERIDETKNQVVVRFQGEEDDVVKLIEFGDTRVSLPSTRFASFPGQSKEGLFGLNTQFQFGPLKVQAIATREKGESQTTSLSRGAIQDSLILYAKDFEKFRFFYIPEAESILNLQVFVDEQRGIQPGTTIPGFAYAFIYNGSSFVPDSGLKEFGNYKPLTSGVDYIFYPNSNILELKSKAGDNHIIAISYLTATGRQVGVIGEVLDSLRLVKPASFPTHVDSLFTRSDSLKALLWNYMLMNIYDIRASFIAPENIDIQIGRDSSGVSVWGENNRSYLNILGLDENNDGRVDLVRQIGQSTVDILDLNKGLLIFPNPLPFALDSLSEPDSLIYKKTRLSYNEGTRYFIKIVKRQISREIYLNQPNILENSEVVRYNGRILERGKEYTVDYTTGKITILDDNILRDPTAKIDISFDYAPLFSLKDKTLWGARLDLPITSWFNLGGSIMGRSESSPQKRPTVGAEPTRSLVGEVDFNLEYSMPWASELLSRFNLIKTQSPTTLRIQGELARSFPNPNIKKYGYVDDMENSKDEVNVVFSIFDWKRGSVPLDKITGLEKDTFYLGRKVVWAGVIDKYKKGDIFDNIPKEDENLPHLVFYLEVYPKENGVASYVSLSQVLSVYGLDFSNYEYLNLIVKGKGARLHIDIGPDISENAVWRDRSGRIVSYDPYVISTEDRNGNGALDEGEDTGLDGVEGKDSEWTPDSEDDGADDYAPYSVTKDYSRVNGTEKNGRLDTEELIVDGRLDLTNNYFEYTIDLDNPDPAIFAGENENGFKTILIPLKDTTYYSKFGNPDWGYIRFIRIWFEDVVEPETLVVAQLKFQGNKYIKSPVRTIDSLYPVGESEKIFVRAVSNTDDPSYTPPPGIELERNPITGRLEQETSLGLRYENLDTKHFGFVTQTKSTPMNFMDYRTIRFYVKPNPNSSAPYPVVFIRLGDSLNYYEYRYKIKGSDWQEIQINIDSLTQIKKQIRDSIITPGPHERGNVSIYGNPSFTQVKSVVFGVMNDEFVPLNGEIWIDELRLGNPRTDPASAAQINADFRLSNIIGANFSFRQLQSNFRPLVGAPTRSDDRVTFYSINADLGTLLPSKWGIRLNLNHVKNYNLSLPLYGVYSDLLLNDEQKFEQRSVGFSRRTSFNFGKSTGSKNLFIKYLLEPLNLSGYLNKDYSSTPRNVRDGFSKGLSFSHGLRIPWTVKKNKLTLSPLPEYRFSGTLTDGFQYYKDILSNLIQRDSTRSFDQNHSFIYSPISNLNLRFDRGHSTDLWRKDESAFSENLSGSLRFSILSILDPSFNLTSNYRENRDRSMQISDSLKQANISSGTNGSVSINLNIQQLFENLGKVFYKDKVDSTGKSVPNPNRTKLKNFASNFQSLRLNYSISENYGIYRVSSRPDWRFRFGFDRDLLADSGEVQRFSNTFTRQYGFDWGARIFKANLSVGGNFTNTVNKVYVSKRYTKNTQWPRINLSNFKLESKFLQKYLRNFTLGFNYQSNYQESGDFGKAPDNKTTSTSFGPSANLLFANGLGVSISFTKSENISTDFRFGERTTKNSDDRFSLRPTYSLASGKVIKLPLGGIEWKLKSPLQLSGDFSWSRSAQLSIVNKKETKLRDQTNLSFNFNAYYSVSRDINASIYFGYRRYLDNLSKRFNSTTNFGINVDFNF